MSFKLKEVVYKIRCREPGCPFLSEFVVKENLMGVTEADIDSESIKIAKNLAQIKHDAIYGRKHQLANPEIFKIGSSYERIGGLTASSVFAPAAQAAGPAETFQRGDVVLRKREAEGLACEVIRGSAHNDGHPGMKYRPGSVFASAAVFHQKSRPVDVVAGEDGTVIAVHDVQELNRTNPAKARELYEKAQEDVFNLLLHLEDYSASLEKKLKKVQPVRTALKPRRAGAKRVNGTARRRTARPAAKKKAAAKARKR